ncbi:MAG: RsmG family class I SAM-dependent methyltransferase [Cyanobacteriota bacterium]|nr:RsmG family class I SAM-dependent methyltransferase [Cyanobacteriota bacterium]
MPDSLPGAAFWEVLGWRPETSQLEQLKALQDQLRSWNSRVNLTRLVEGDDYWINQVFDSLWPLHEELCTPHQSRLAIDVGTGGGFPGLAVAIALPGTQMTLLDSVGRKTAAVQAMVDALNLRDRVNVRTDRIESAGHDPTLRGGFNLAMARAVAAAPVVAEYLVPLLQPQGSALLYRGQWGEADQRQLKRALLPLKAQLSSSKHCQLPADRGVRHLIRVQPVSLCPRQFPRAVGVPSRQPLGD